MASEYGTHWGNASQTYTHKRQAFYLTPIIQLQRLTKGKHNWTLAEVVHGIVILSHFHSLSSFVFSCGLTQELDPTSSPKYKSQTPQKTASSSSLSPNKKFSFNRTNSNSNTPSPTPSPPSGTKNFPFSEYSINPHNCNNLNAWM